MKKIKRINTIAIELSIFLFGAGWLFGLIIGNPVDFLGINSRIDGWKVIQGHGTWENDCEPPILISPYPMPEEKSPETGSYYEYYSIPQDKLYRF